MKQTGAKSLSGISGLIVLIMLLSANAACALEYVSVSDNTAVLYDANSTKSKKLFVISRYTPLEAVVNLQNWIKVRDSSGTMAWIERRSVSDKHYVVVNVALASVLRAPEANAPVIYQVPRNVAMESLGVNGGGWIRVRDQDGTLGYMKSIEVWGAE
jgi:SH3-like domain-containing protein